MSYTKNANLKVITCEATGENGLIVEGVKIIKDEPMAALEGRVIAHDLLEHPNGLESIGSVDDELEALGGVYFVRCGYSRLSDHYSNEESLSYDVVTLGLIHLVNNVSFKTPVPILDHDSIDDQYDILDFFKSVVSFAKKGMYSEIEDLEYNCTKEEIDQLVNNYLNNALNYMLQGYIKTFKRFEGDNWDAYLQFEEIAFCMDVMLKHEKLYTGDRFFLEWGCDTNKARVSKYYPLDDGSYTLDEDEYLSQFDDE